MSWSLAMDGMPRVLDVREYAAAREAEVQALCEGLKSLPGSKYGATALPRHLRRRATSHKPYITKRRPNLKLAAYKHLKPSVFDGWLSQQGKSASQAAEPRPTNRAMRRRPERLQVLAELSCMADLAATQLAPLVVTQSATRLSAPSTAACPIAVGLPVPHAMPAAIHSAAMLQQEQEQEQQEEQQEQSCWAAGTGATDGLPQQQLQHQGASIARDSCTNVGEAAEPLPTLNASLRRLETHIWHARRFKMHTRWGHVLAQHAPGRGAGSRSFLSTLRQGCVMHDASYWGCMQLSGSQLGITRLLQSIGNPAAIMAQQHLLEVFDGAVEWEFMLHQPSSFPQHPIAPARAIWHMCFDSDVCTAYAASVSNKASSGANGGGLAGPAAAMAATDGSQCTTQGPSHDQASVDAMAACGNVELLAHSLQQDQPVGLAADCPLSAVRGSSLRVEQSRLAGRRGGRRNVDDGWRPYCQLWLWVHAAGFKDAWAAVHDAEKQRREAGAPAVRITSRCPTLRRLELAGAGVEAALHRVLHATHAGSAESTAGTYSGAQIWESIGQQQAQGSLHSLSWCWPDGAALAITAHDPRLFVPVRVGAATVPVATQPASGGGSCGMDVGSRVAPAQAAGGKELLSIQQVQKDLWAWPAHAGHWTSAAGPLWASASEPLPRPLSGSQLGLLRNTARQQYLHPTSIARATAPDVASRAAASAQQAAAPHCPVLVLRHLGSGSWSLILPAGWVKPFWMALAFTGARPAGQVEWHWLANHIGAASFPQDFPDTPAGQRLAHDVRKGQAEHTARRPKGRIAPQPMAAHVMWDRLLINANAAGAVGQVSTSGSAELPERLPVRSGTWWRHHAVAVNAMGKATGTPVATGSMGTTALTAGSCTTVGTDAAHLPSPDAVLPDCVTLVDEHATSTDGGSAQAATQPMEVEYCAGQALQAAAEKASEGDTQPAAPQLFVPTAAASAPPSSKPRVAQLPHGLSTAVTENVTAMAVHAGSNAAPRRSWPYQSWFVVRSLSVLRIALSQVHSSNSRSGRKWTPSSSCSGTTCRPARTVEKALVTGQLAWLPKVLVPTGSSHTPMPAGEHLPWHAAQQPWPLVRVTVRVLGKGCCKGGARLCSLLPPPVLQQDHSVSPSQQAAPSQRVLTECSATAVGSAQTSAGVVMGYITSGSPRGACGYPGGTGYCCATSLWRLRSAQHVSGRINSGVAEVQLGLINPGTTALRRVAVRVVLEGGGSEDTWL